MLLKEEYKKFKEWYNKNVTVVKRSANAKSRYYLYKDTFKIKKNANENYEINASIRLIKNVQFIANNNPFLKGKHLLFLGYLTLKFNFDVQKINNCVLIGDYLFDFKNLKLINNNSGFSIFLKQVLDDARVYVPSVHKKLFNLCLENNINKYSDIRHRIITYYDSIYLKHLILNIGNFSYKIEFNDIIKLNNKIKNDPDIIYKEVSNSKIVMIKNRKEFIVKDLINNKSVTVTPQNNFVLECIDFYWKNENIMICRNLFPYKEAEINLSTETVKLLKRKY